MTEKISAYRVEWIEPSGRVVYGFVQAGTKAAARLWATENRWTADRVGDVNGPFEKDPRVVMNA